MRRRSLLLLVFLVLSAGCGSFFPLGRTTRHRPIHGQYIDLKVVNEIVPGSTTKQQIVDRFGKPDRIDKTSERVEQYFYDYLGLVEETTERIAWATRDTSNEQKSLRVVFDGDVVRSFAYTNSAIPSENLAKGVEGLPESYVVLLPREDGSPGAVEVSGTVGKTMLAEAWKAAALTGDPALVEISKEDVEKIFKEALAAMPKEPIRFILYFKNDTTDLTAESRKRLPEILSTVRNQPAPDVDVVGHTDTFGPPTYNDPLALRRAKRIRDEIVAIGVDRKMIEVTSRGKRDPLIKTRDGVHEQRNRRVEVIVR